VTVGSGIDGVENAVRVLGVNPVGTRFTYR